MLSSAFHEGLLHLALDLDATALDRLARYRDLIAATAKEVNITSVRDAAAIEQRHLVESLAILRALEEASLLPQGARVVDIGSGAGLPGLPIKIARPDIDLTLIEAVGKKCAFMRDTVADLALDGVTVVEGRAEDAGRDAAHREHYDLALARAVAPLPVLLEYAIPFLRVDGRLAATKGSAAARELEEAAAALTALYGTVERVLPIETPGLTPQTLIIVRKQGATPERYPRRNGVPAHRPLP